jgi:pSer/pThr/pTyr-binding forkhead associated (FHA) protein
MNQLTLDWLEAGQPKQQILSDQQITKIPGTTRIGRDATQSDIVIADMTVAPCHVEIFFNPQQQCFYLRNLRKTNPPVIRRRWQHPK